MAEGQQQQNVLRGVRVVIIRTMGVACDFSQTFFVNKQGELWIRNYVLRKTTEQDHRSAFVSKKYVVF